MVADRLFYPDAMDASDVAQMRQSVRMATEALGVMAEADSLLLASIVFRYYRRGVVDPERLTAIAIFLSSSRVFRYQPLPASGADGHYLHY